MNVSKVDVLRPFPEVMMSLSTVKSPGEGGGEGEGTTQGNVINLLQLQPAQLQSLKQQVEQELTFYQEAVMSLKEVQLKMVEAGNCVKSLTPEKKELLVPVTGSVSLLLLGNKWDSNLVYLM